MPFDDDYTDLPEIANKQVSGLKNVSTQKSIFDNVKKKPTQEDLDKKVKNIEEKNSLYKQRTSELAIQFKKISEDKTLPQNRNIFTTEMEREILSNMIQLASEINNDPIENEGMGSLSLIAQLFKQCLSQRDRMNKMEYAILELEKKIVKT